MKNMVSNISDKDITPGGRNPEFIKSKRNKIKPDIGYNSERKEYTRPSAVMGNMKLKIDDTLSLVPIALEYAHDIFENFKNEIIRYIPLDRPPEKIEETIAFIESSINARKAGTDLVWVILFQKDFSGCCGLHTLQSRQPHFGLWIKKDHQGKGLGKKVVKFMLDWGISNLDVEYIKYPVDVRNKRSLSLIRNLKLIPSGRYEMGDQKKLDVIEYRLYKK